MTQVRTQPLDAQRIREQLRVAERAAEAGKAEGTVGGLRRSCRAEGRIEVMTTTLGRMEEDRPYTLEELEGLADACWSRAGGLLGDRFEGMALAYEDLKLALKTRALTFA